MTNRLSDVLAAEGKPINLADIAPLVGDGVTDNLDTFQNIVSPGYFVRTQGPSFPVTVTLTLGSPGVVNWANHGLRVNDTVVFSTTGVLPTGLVAGQFYYVMYTGLTLNSFQVSATDAWTTFQSVQAPTPGDGPAVNFTGSQSGSQSVTVYGNEWQDIRLPPLPFHSSSNAQLAGNLRRARFHCYGASGDNIVVSANRTACAGYGGFCGAPANAPSFTGAYIKGFSNSGVSAAGLNSTAFLVNLVDAPLFWIGGWVLIGALDLQNNLGLTGSWPPNNHYFEFAQIAAINGSTGQITFANPLRNSYSVHFPIFVNNNVASPGNATSNVMGGPATMWPLHPDWDAEYVLKGLHNVKNGQTVCSVRKLTMIDCLFDGPGQQGPVPSNNQEWSCENCSFNCGGIEVDKNVEIIRFKQCNFFGGNNSGIEVQSSTPDLLVIEGCQIPSLAGTAKNTAIRDSLIQSLVVGPEFYGCAESLLIENSRISNFSEVFPLYEQVGQAVQFAMLLNNYTFNNGVLQTPLISTPNFWPVPGRKAYVTDLNGTFDSMGSPFTVFDVYTKDGSSSTVTFSIANPGVVNWTAHGLSAGNVVFFSTLGGADVVGLPAGLYTYTPYYVLSSGLTSNAFEIATTPGGSAIAFADAGTGTTTAHANSRFNIATTLSAMPVGNSTQSTVTISVDSPAVVTWTAHGLTANTPVVFQTTGALPTGLNNQTIYYVLAAGLTTNTFEVSTSPGGSAVNTTGSQSGTQTAIANPLMFKVVHIPKITVINSTGCPQIADISNGPPNLPLYSYGSRRIVGLADTNPADYSPSMQVRGNLVSLTIEVERAFTGSGSFALAITAKAFNSSLIESDLSLSVDCTVAGTRVVTPLGVTGAAGADSLAAFGNWISGSIATLSNNGSSTLDQNPTVRITAQTDQGAPVVLLATSNENASVDQIVDTSPYHGFVD